jgi:pimeloyl-ACP methyl ester carboxylesterase
MSSPQAAQSPVMRFVDAPTRTVDAAGATFVYRELGSDSDGSLPLMALTHLGANLDSWDPEVVDPLATQRRVILIGYRGVGDSTGTTRDSLDDMASDAIAVIGALGLQRIDLFGMSMGGMVAQAIVEQAPDLVDRLILAGSGPRGGSELDRMSGVMVRSILRGAATFTKPTTLLFFTRTPNGIQAADAYQHRLTWRETGRDKAVALNVIRTRLGSVGRWARQRNSSASGRFTGPVLILHGDSDRMVPVANVTSLAAVFPQAELRIFSDSGHGVVFQNRREAAETIGRFLGR